MDLKDYLKTLKMNESRISAIVGGLIILVIGIMVFNYFKNLNTGITTPTSINTESTPSEQTYTVQKGDTLWGIAQSQLGDGFKWKEIADANEITNVSQITAGQELIIPTVESTPSDESMAMASPKEEISMQTTEPTPVEIVAPATPIATPQTVISQPDQTMTNDNQSTISGDTYTVVHGDNLWDIAVRAYGDGTRWHDIASANKLENPRIIHTGNVFTLPR